MGALSQIRHRSGDENEDRTIQRRAGELQLARFSRTRRETERDALFERYLPLARSLAARYRHTSEPFDDLLQVASLGLLKAIDRFDLDRGIAFSSYAVPTILGELKRHFRDRTWSVRVPRDLQELVLKVDGTVSDLGRELHRAPTVTEISQRLSVAEEDILEAMQAGGAYRATSLETPRGDEEGDTLADSLGTDEDGFAQAEHRATLDRLLSAVGPREREVLRLRFQEDLTQAEIGERIGVSQMQVSRLIRQAVARLRVMAEAGDRPRPRGGT
jgi:RNA polymerase sigma-B factor